MKISQALNLFTHLIALMGFLTISVTGQVDAVSIYFFVFSLLLSFVNERFQKQYYLSQNIVTTLAFILVLYVLASVIFFGAEVFDAILTFLIYIQVIKLLGKKDMRDIVQIYILSFFQFLAGAVLTVDFSYGLAFIVYVSVALWAIIVLTMKKELIEASSNDDPRVVTPLFLSTSVIISFSIFMFTAMLFVSVPRLRTGFITGNFLKPEFLKSGFSDEVKLGQVGEIKLDNSPVMRIRILDHNLEDLPNPIYWRGIALDEFDGAIWRISDANYKIHKKGRDEVIGVKDTENKVVSQEIITEPLDTDVLFAGSFPVGFRGLVEGRIAEVNDSYILPNKISYRLKYIAYSDLSIPSPEELRNESEDYPHDIKKRYLQLPMLSKRIEELAREITHLDRNAYDKATSIKRYLISNMSYTLTLEKGTGEFLLEDFLFENKAGHCEYFATAMVVLLREVGIPARIVNGFLGGEWNEHGKFFLVRESNAHSWVEVFFPKHGWVLFDPTPAGDEGFLTRSRFSFITSYIDYLKYRWSRYVVDFNQKDQIRLLSSIQDRWRWQKSKVQNKVDFKLGSNKKWVLAILLVALTTLIMLSKPEVKSLFSYRRRKPDEKATTLYRKALLLLSKKNFRKAGFATPREFARDVVSRGGREFQTFQEFTEKYLDLRFGGGDIDTELKELEKLLARLKKEIR